MAAYSSYSSLEFLDDYSSDESSKGGAAMPREYYEADDMKVVDKRPCANTRADLKKCLMESDCVKVHKKSPRECLLTRDPSVPEECYELRIAFFECKRSLLDNRQRFRGRKDY